MILALLRTGQPDPAAPPDYSLAIVAAALVLALAAVAVALILRRQS